MVNRAAITACNRAVSLWWIWWIVIATPLFSLSALSQPAATSCRIIDPELQGYYTGGCVNGLAEGKGEAAGTAQYRGDFKAGKKHGKGIKLWPATGDRYEGDFADDRKEGSGIYVWGPRSAWAGEKYTGAYLSDMRHGYGIYEWSREDRYTGPWANDIATGPATPAMILRARAYSEALAAIARPGIKVCREMKVGIATIEWIKGNVIAVEEDGIAVRIDDPGQMGHLIRGITVNKGALIKDDFPNWKPC